MTTDPISSPGRPTAPATSATAALIRRAAGGDVAAFERLVRLHERRVLGISRRLLGGTPADGGDAEDAAQETFLRLYRALPRIDPERPLTPYLDRITVNVCRDLGRRRSRRRELPLAGAERSHGPDDDPALTVEPVDPRPGPADDAALSQVRRLAAAVLRELPFKQRAALVLRELHGLSTREVADALESSETSVRSHVCRARLALRERLAAVRGPATNPSEEVP